MVTGKNKEKFEEWCCENGNYALYNKKYLALMDEYDCFIIYFDELPIEMQKGVYEAYYDSLGNRIDTFFMPMSGQYGFEINEKFAGEDLDSFNTRKEAFTQALKEADKLINKEL